MNPTLTQAVEDYFRARPGVWIDGMVIAQVGGCYASRSRISDCRTKRLMQIDNRQRKVGRRTVSEYRYVPAAAPVQPSLLGAGA